jgi:hypothetical protein
VFTVDGTVQTPSATVTNGVATLQVTLATGAHTFSVAYGGNSYYLSSTGTQSITVIPAGTSSVTLAVTNTGTITYGQAVAVTSTITTGNATATPTGTVAFSVDGVVQKTLTYAATLSTTLTVPAGTHTLAAAYSGDFNYQAGTGTTPVTLAKAQPAIALTLTPTATTSANTIVMTATVSSSISTPTGTVTYTNGTTTLGTGPLNGSGVATYTNSNQTTAATFTASYGGDSNFLAATVTLTPAATFLISNLTGTVQLAQNGVGTGAMQVNSFYNYVGTVSVNCTNVPSYVVCRGVPSQTTMTANGTAAVALQVYADVTPAATAANRSPKMGRRSALAMAACMLLLLPFARRRGMRLLMVLMAALVVAGGVVGCGTGVSDVNNDITPTGMYTATLNVTDGSQTTSGTLTLVVLPATSQR